MRGDEGMKIVESIDSFCQTVYRLEEGRTLVAIFFRRHDAEVAKTALEENRKVEERSFW